jgi:hypothetical protein
MARTSRHNVIAAIGAAPLMAQGDFAKAALADPVLVLCAHYGDLLCRREAIMGAWGRAWAERYVARPARGGSIATGASSFGCTCAQPV